MLLELGEEGIDEHIAPRREFNPFAPKRLEALYCYGVDFLSTKDVLAVFHDFSPSSIEWIDDSSCIVVFNDEEAPTKVLQELAGSAREPDQPWTVTRLLRVASNALGGGANTQKGKKGVSREFRLQLREATEADRKDVGHSGHVDSAYYAGVKEQQALQKQALERRREKKRQRRPSRPHAAAVTGADSAMPAAEAADAPKQAAGAESVQAASVAQTPAQTPAEAQSAVQGAQKTNGAGLQGATGLGRRGLLDPLLFLHAPGGAGEATSKPKDEASSLQSFLHKAEAEYTAIMQLPDTESSTAAGVSKGAQKQLENESALGGSHQTVSPVGKPGRGRPEAARGRAASREGTPRRGRERTPRGRESTPQARGKKRRAVSQEPRPASAAMPPPRKVKAMPEVEAFLMEADVRCTRVALQCSFRHIMFQRSKKAPQKAMDVSEKPPETSPGEQAAKPNGTTPASADKELPPWEHWMKVNSRFIRTGHFMHTVAFEVEGRRVLAVVPHPMHVDQERLARAAQKPAAAVKMRKLAAISKETGWPVFICPPFAHPKDAQGRQPLLLVDSSVTELKRPMLFDCGTVGLSMPVSAFLSSTKAACVEGLAKPPPAAKNSTPAPAEKTQPGPAEPATSAASSEAVVAGGADSGGGPGAAAATSATAVAGMVQTPATADVQGEAVEAVMGPV